MSLDHLPEAIECELCGKYDLTSPCWVCRKEAIDRGDAKPMTRLDVALLLLFVAFMFIVFGYCTGRADASVDAYFAGVAR